MRKVVKILMVRDGLSHQEAVELCKDTKAEMMEAIECGDYAEAEEIFYENIGLELDYIPMFIW